MKKQRTRSEPELGVSKFPAATFVFGHPTETVNVVGYCSTKRDHFFKMQPSRFVVTKLQRAVSHERITKIHRFELIFSCRFNSSREILKKSPGLKSQFVWL